MIEDGEEIPLLGGDVTEGLVRVGDTVRRPAGERAELVQDVLLYLEKAGFDGAPRFLGIDSAGRQALTYIDGEVAGRPRPPWIADEERMLSIARLLRRYHDAVEGFGMPTNLPAPIEPPGLPDLDDPPELVGHQDLSESDRRRLMALSIGLNERAWHTMKYRAETLGGGWQRMWSEGVGDKIRHRQIWLEKNADSLTTALLS